MIAHLTFEPLGTAEKGRALRRAVFVRRAELPLSRVYAFARLAQECAARLVGADASVRVTDTVVVDPTQAAVVFDAAVVIEVAGADATLYAIVHTTDAHRLIARIYGEQEQRTGDLSPLELLVIRRLVREIAACADLLCGEIHSLAPVRRDPASYRCASYFELFVDGARIGIAVSADITAPVERTIAPRVVDELAFKVEARFARGKITAAALGSLAVGEVVLFETRVYEPAWLAIGDTPIAHGVCGHAGSVGAFTVHEVSEDAPYAAA